MGEISSTMVPLQSSSEETPRLIWWLQGEDRQNFGDYLTDFLWKNLGDGMRVAGDGYRLIGSAISDGTIHDDLRTLGKWEHGRIVFWCCGSRDGNPLTPESLARSVFCGARGPLTRDALKLPRSMPIGDPGLLLPLLYQPRPSKNTKGKTLCVPHILDNHSDEYLLDSTGAEVIVRPSIANSPEALTTILDEIVSAEFILAGSLHAAIIACAYDVPFCYFDSGYVDVPFKWRDFSASVNIGTFFVDRVSEGRKIYETLVLPRLRRPLLFPILAAAPFRVRSAQLLAAALHDAERLGARARIDIEAFSAFVDLANHEVAVEGSEPYRRNLSEAEERLKKETLAHSDARQKLAEMNEKFNEAEAKVKESEAKVKESEAKVKESEAKVKESEAKVKESEAKVKESEAKVKEALFICERYLNREAGLTAPPELIASKDKQIAEYLYHLDRINASPWWRFGMWFTKLIRVPATLSSKSIVRLRRLWQR